MHSRVIYGCAREASKLDDQLARYLDRGWNEISPIEHAVMRIGTYEYLYCKDVPWRVVLNECIELAKSFGGTDGHKYVNGVLHQLAGELRPGEIDQREGKEK
jgi:N utilization substance protein B